MKHTPGPWIYSDAYAHEIIPNRYHEAAITGITSFRTPEETKANAKLMACAPEMLEALIMADHVLTTTQHDHECITRHVRAVIDKATQ